MTPDQLNEIEARAKADSLYLNDRWVKDVLALVARVWELEDTGRLEILRGLRDRAEHAEARALDLEQSLDQWQGSHENEVAKREKAEAKVKELETALTKRAIMLPRCPDCGAYVGPQPP